MRPRECPRGPGALWTCCSEGDKLAALQVRASFSPAHSCISQLTYFCIYTPSVFKEDSRPFLGDGAAP